MNPLASDPAGAITVELVTRDGRVDAARLKSSRRTDLARRLFAGRPVEHLLSTLPLVFSVCATAQAAAAVRACEHAAAVEPDPAHVQARELLVLAETAREHLFRILLGWSGWLGTPPSTQGLAALGRMRGAWAAALYPGSDAFRPGGGELSPDRPALAGLVGELRGLVVAALGGPADAFAQLGDTAALRRWVGAGEAVAPRLLAQVIGRGHAGLGGSGVDVLPELDAAALGARLAADDADAFVAAPQWAGVPRETGALERQRDAPLVAALRADYGNALLTRLVARLTELAVTLDRIGWLVERLGAAPAAAGGRLDGSGVAQVEAARGRLVHWVRLSDGLVGDYRILAPTEWNFHPEGALAVGLSGLPADAQLEPLARLLVDAIDPCVESRVEVIADA